MTLLICWLLFPAVLGALSLGCAGLVERIAGVRVPGPLLLPIGLAAIVVVAQFVVWTDATAELAAPVVVALAAIGLAISRPWAGRRLDRWAVAAACAVFAAFAAPVVLSGEATFAGYLRLDDTATWFAITDHVMEHSRDLGSLEPSSYEGWVRTYLSSGYPIGTFLPLGIGRTLVGQDVAWVFQPYIAFLAAMLALALYALAAPLVSSPALRAAVVFVAAQPAILFGYSLVGGVKEVLTVALLALIAALAIAAAREKTYGWRFLVPLAFVVAAAVDALSYGVSLWLLPLLVPALALTVRLHGADVAVRRALALSGLVVVLSLAALPALGSFLGSSTGTFTSESEIGTLLKPLSPLQPFGIWPVGDFRLNPKHLLVTDLLIFVLIAGALAGLAFAWRRQAWEMIVYVGAAAVGCLVISAFGAPWVDGKSFAIASPAVVLTGLAGAAAAARRGRLIAALVAGPIAFGVLWSNVLAYHDVNLAPRDRLTELEQIGERLPAGRTLMTQYELYGTRHFLRKGDPQGASEILRRPVPRAGAVPTLTVKGFEVPSELGASADALDIDGFALRPVLAYRNLVLDRSPTGSRPPSAYRLVWRGRFYELWKRNDRSDRILEHLPLGTRYDPTGRPSCRSLQRLARRRGTQRLAAAVRPPPRVVELSQRPHPSSWQTDDGDPAILYPYSPGRMAFDLELPKGRYRFWLGRSVRRKMELRVDGRLMASRTNELEPFGQFLPMGESALASGRHRIELDYGDADLHPGSGDGGQTLPVGPFAVTSSGADPPVAHLLPDDVLSLCGRQLDWVEALGS